MLWIQKLKPKRRKMRIKKIYFFENKTKCNEKLNGNRLFFILIIRI